MVLQNLLKDWSERKHKRLRVLNLILTVFFFLLLLEAGVLKENPPVGFWPKRFPPKPREGVVLVVEAGVADVPKAVPKENPPVLAAGALQKDGAVYYDCHLYSVAAYPLCPSPFSICCLYTKFLLPLLLQLLESKQLFPTDSYQQ